MIAAVPVRCFPVAFPVAFNMSKISTAVFNIFMVLGMVHHDLSRDVRKPVFGVSDQVPHKPGLRNY